MFRFLSLSFYLLFLSANLFSQLNITRGPYLQKATQESIIIRWQTDIPVSSKLTFGFQNQNHFGVRYDTVPKMNHSFEITGLLSNTNYSYSIGQMDSMIIVDKNLYFTTLPNSGDIDDYSFIILGDAGQGSVDQKNVALALENEYGTHHDGIILLGDNAYWSGTQSEYQDKFFDGFYNSMIENTVIWPAPGNHDYYSASVPMTPTAPYFDIFDLPANAECGGFPSGTEQYYSFDYGNIHFLSLDSYAVDRSDTASMAQWMIADLEQNELPWIIAFWHHPPYSKGSHDSDNSDGTDEELVEMRTNILPILEKYDVDLVLNGHSHSYERSHFITNHYGPSNSFNDSNMIVEHAGNYPEDCPYLKYSSEDTTHQGTVYTILGVSGRIDGVQTDWPHPAMISYSNDFFGGMHLSINGSILTSEFLTDNGEVFDRFEIWKDISFVESELCGIEYVEWNVFPNPANLYLNFNNDLYVETEGDYHSVHDINGKLVYHNQLQSNNSIYVDQLESGIYILQLKDSDGIKRFRFVKN